MNDIMQTQERNNSNNNYYYKDLFTKEVTHNLQLW